MPQREDILKQLSHIIDPDLNQDIVTLGFVKNLVIKGGDVSFEIELTTPACPIKSQFEQQAKKLVSEIKGVTGVKVAMTSMVKKTKPAPQNKQSTLNSVKNIIAVSSCKGGVGKSTVAALLSQELAGRGFKVGLVDVDIHGPSVPALFNLKNAQIYKNEKNHLIPIEKNGLKIMSFGFLLGDSAAVMRGPMVSNYVNQVIHATDWGELDYLFIDMPPGTGDVQLTITQTLRLNGAVIVTTRQNLSLIDVSRGILMFEKVDVPILGIIENMSYFVCSKCNEKHYIFGGEKASALEERFGLETLAEIPLLTELTHAIDKPSDNEHIKTAVDNTMRALGKDSILRKQVPETSFDKEKVILKWASGEEVEVSNRDLRLSCRCALCVNEMTGEKVLTPEKVKEGIAPVKITPLGNYAIGIDWNDGHTSGIYPYKSIKALAGQRQA